MRGLSGSLAMVMLLVLSASQPPAASGPAPPEPAANEILKVGSPDEMKTRNPLPAIASDVWTRSVLDRVYDTVLLTNSTTEAPIAYVAKGVDVDEDGRFSPASEYDAWEERTSATTPLAITVYYDFNGVRWHDGTQMDGWDLFFAYHVNAMHPVRNGALRVLFAGGTDATYEAGERQLNVTLAVKDWEGETALPGDPNLRVAVTFALNGPWALFPRTLSPKLLPMHEWSRTGGGRHTDFGCAIWMPQPEADARGLSACGTGNPALYGRGVKPTDVVPGSRPYDYTAAEGWAMTDADVIGSGPFKSLRWTLGVVADVDRNDDYYTGVDANGTVYDPVLPTRIHKPSIGGIRFLVYRDAPLLVLALERGEIDYIHGYVPPEFVPELLGRPEIDVTGAAEPGFSYLGYNLRRSPWGYNSTNLSRDDGLVLRQAIAHVIDKMGIVINLLQNFGTIAHGVVNPANTYWYNDNIPKYAYGLSTAMAILDSPEARAVGIGPKPSGQIDALCDQTNPSQCRVLARIGNQPFYILTPNAEYDPVRSAAGAMIADAMRRVGLNAVAQPAAFGTIVSAIATHNFDLYILDWEISTIDPDFMFDLFHSSNAANGQNYVGFDNATFDDAIDASRAELDRPTRRSHIFTAQQIIAEDRPYDVLYFRTRIEAYRQDRFVNWTLTYGTFWNGWSLLGIHPPETYTIAITTAPPGLSVVVGGMTRVAPVTLDCTTGQTIILGVPPPQVIGASRYTFESWSDGEPEWHAISCTGNATITATFSTEHYVTVQTVPAGLDVTVGSVAGPAPVSDWCAEGSTITVRAPSPQGGPDTRLAFASWSDGGSATHQVPCTAPTTLTATYATEFRITVDSDPAGVPLTVNGTDADPGGFWCPQGGTVTAGAPDQASVNATIHGFIRWSDGGAREHAVDCSAPAHLTATYREMPRPVQPDWPPLGLAVIAIVAAMLAVLLALVWRRKRTRAAP